MKDFVKAILVLGGLIIFILIFSIANATSSINKSIYSCTKEVSKYG
jgi:uncharacterized membrane protein